MEGIRQKRRIEPGRERASPARLFGNGEVRMAALVMMLD